MYFLNKFVVSLFCYYRLCFNALFICVFLFRRTVSWSRLITSRLKPLYFRNVMCSPPDMYQGFAKKLWGLTSLTVIALSFCIYFVVRRKLLHTGAEWTKKRRMTFDINIPESLCQDHRLFRSIFAVMCVIILGWLFSMIIFNFVRNGLSLQGFTLSTHNIPQFFPAQVDSLRSELISRGFL